MVYGSQIIVLYLHVSFMQTYTVPYINYSSIKLEENKKKERNPGSGA